MFFNGKQKLIKILIVAIVLLTVLSTCLASYTFARYSTSADGTGTSTIALWDVSISPKTTTTPSSGTYDGAVTFGKLSPGDQLTTGDYLVYNETATIDLASVTYKTDVAVSFSIQTSDFTIYFNDGSTLVRTVDASSGASFTITSADSAISAENTIAYYVATIGTSAYVTATYNVMYNKNSTTIDYGSATSTQTLGSWDSTNHTWGSNSSSFYPSYRDIAELFTVDISYSGDYSGDFEDTTDYSGSLISGHTYSVKSNNTWGASTTEKTIDISGSLVWSIARPAQGDDGYDADGHYYWATYLCDWVGKYVDSISYTFTYAARQASETNS